MLLHSSKILKKIYHPWLFKLGKWNNGHFVLTIFDFEAYAKNVREKGTKCSLKTAEVLLDVGGHMLT